MLEYVTDASSKGAKLLGRRQAGLGETANFAQRLSAYRASEGWTNGRQATARLVDVPDQPAVDVIRCFEQKILLVMPATSPSGLQTQPLYRKTLETLLNLAFGVTRRPSRPWGLQARFIDNSAYEHIITADLADEIRWKTFAAYVRWDDQEEKLVAKSVIPPSSDSFWQGLAD